MGNQQRVGGLLIVLAVVCAVAAIAWWGWENSDSRENERETQALTEAMAGAGQYREPEPNLGPVVFLGGLGAVLVVAGVVLVKD